jgi:hypothetical protein
LREERKEASSRRGASQRVIAQVSGVRS